MGDLLQIILLPLTTLFDINYYTMVLGSGLLLGVLIFLIITLFRSY